MGCSKLDIDRQRRNCSQYIIIIIIIIIIIFIEGAQLAKAVFVYEDSNRI